MSDREIIEKNPVDFSLSYPLSADEIDKVDIDNLAEKHDVEIKDYWEVEFIRLLGSGVNRDNIDDEGNLIEKYEKEYVYYSFMDETTFNQITGENLKVADGTYFMIRKSSMYENQ